MEAQARKEAAEDEIALEKAKGKILPDNVAAELTIMLRKRADEAAKEALYYADRMAAEVENSVPVGASNGAERTSTSAARPRLMRCACWVCWETLEARKMTVSISPISAVSAENEARVSWGNYTMLMHPAPSGCRV